MVIKLEPYLLPVLLVLFCFVFFNIALVIINELCHMTKMMAKISFIFVNRYRNPSSPPAISTLTEKSTRTRAFFRKMRRTGQQIGKSNMVAEDLKSFGKKNQLTSIQDRKERAPWHLLLLKYYRRHLVVNRPKIDGKSGRKRKKS